MDRNKTIDTIFLILYPTTMSPKQHFCKSSKRTIGSVHDFYYEMIPVLYNSSSNKEGSKPGDKANPATPYIPLGAGAGVVDDDEILAVAAAEREVAEREAHDDGDEHAAVERHDGEHEQVAEAGVDPDHGGHGHTRRPAAPGDGHEEWRPRVVAGGWRDGGGWLSLSGGAASSSSFRGELHADSQGLEVLVEGGGEEQGREGEEVVEPRGGAPAVEEDRGRLAPVEGHVHHVGWPAARAEKEKIGTWERRRDERMQEDWGGAAMGGRKEEDCRRGERPVRF